MDSASQPDRHGRVVVPGGPQRRGVGAPARPGIARQVPDGESLQRALQEIGGWLERPLTLETVALRLLERIDSAFPALQSALFVASPREGGGDGDSKWNAERPLEVAACRGLRLDEERAIWVEGIARDALSHCQVLGRESNASPLASFLWVPVLHQGERLGVLQLADERPRAMAGSRPRELGRLADELGVVLARCFELEEERAREIESSERLRRLERECAQLRRERTAHRARDFLLHAALARAERRIPSDGELEALAVDLRELQWGDSAAETWFDLRDSVVRVAELSEAQEGFFAFRSDELPPVRCQRLRLEGLLGALIARAPETAGRDGSGWIELRTRAGCVECEVGVEGDDVRSQSDAWRAWFDEPEARDAALDIVQDQGGELGFDVAAGRTSIRLTLPVDATLR